MKDISLAVKIDVLLAVVVLIYWEDLAQVFGKALILNAGNISNYVFVVPFLLAYVIYRKRKVLRVSVAYREAHGFGWDQTMGIALCFGAIVLYIYGSSTLYAIDYHILSLPIFLGGATMLIFNIRTFRHVIFAIILTAFLEAPPGEFVSALSADLSWMMAVMVQVILHSFGLPVSVQGTLGAPALMVTKNGFDTPIYVGESSSGSFSLLGLPLFAAFVAYIIRNTFWKRVVIFGMGFPIFFILNMLRIAVIVTLWYAYGETVSESFHVISGSVMVAGGTIVLLLIGEKIFKIKIWGQRIPLTQCPICEKSRGAGESLCLLCGRLLKQISTSLDRRSIGRIVILIMIAAVMNTVQVQTYFSSAAAVRDTPLSILDISKIEGPDTTRYFLPQLPGYDLQFAYRDLRIETLLRQDAALAFTYTAQNATTTIFSGIQISTGQHHWEASLVIAPSLFGRPVVTVLRLEDIDITPLQKARFFMYQRPDSNLTEAVLYWFVRTPLRFGDGFEDRNVSIMIWSYTDELARGGLIKASSDVQGTEKLFLSFAKPINDHWNGLTAPSQRQNAMNAVNRNQHVLAAGIILPPTLVYLTHRIKNRSLQLANRKLFNQMPMNEEKLVIDAILHGCKGKLTGESIVKVYTRLTGKSITQDKLLEVLEVCRRAGLILEDISNKSDEPVLVWRPNFGPESIFNRLKKFLRNEEEQ